MKVNISDQTAKASNLITLLCIEPGNLHQSAIPWGKGEKKGNYHAVIRSHQKQHIDLRSLKKKSHPPWLHSVPALKPPSSHRHIMPLRVQEVKWAKAQENMSKRAAGGKKTESNRSTFISQQDNIILTHLLTRVKVIFKSFAKINFRMKNIQFLCQLLSKWISSNFSSRNQEWDVLGHHSMPNPLLGRNPI